MKVLSVSRLLPPVVVAVLLGAVYAVAAFGRPVTLGGGTRALARTLPVTTATRVCPSVSRTAPQTVAMIAADAGRGGGRAAGVLLGSAVSAPVFTLTQPGQLSVSRVTPGRAARGGSPSAGPSSSASGSQGGGPVRTLPASGGVVVQASGAMAQGLAVEKVASGSSSSLTCTSPGTDFWFVGPGQRNSSGRLQLYLMNPGSQAADVSVAVATDAGPLQGVQDSGIQVAPHAMVVQSFARALHGANVASLHVRTSVGQVVAAVEVTSGAGGSGGWLPPAQQPARQLVVPGIPGTAGARELYVAVPGTGDAHLHLTAVTTRGSYEPVGGSLDIPGGSAVNIALPSLAGIPTALKLTATAPVTASVMLRGGSAGAPGVFTVATPALAEQGVIAFNRSGGGMASQLVLSAPGKAVSARIWRGTSLSAGAASVVRVKAGQSLVVQLSRPPGVARGAPFAVTITPLAGSGPLYAGRVMEGTGAGAALSAMLPVTSALTTVPLPDVRDALIVARP